MSQDLLFGLLLGLFAASIVLNVVLVRVILRAGRRLNAALDGAASYITAILPEFRRDVIALISKLDGDQMPHFPPRPPAERNKARRTIGFRKEDIR
jgi:hypothetical protein